MPRPHGLSLLMGALFLSANIGYIPETPLVERNAAFAARLTPCARACGGRCVSHPAMLRARMQASHLLCGLSTSAPHTSSPGRWLRSRPCLCASFYRTLLSAQSPALERRGKRERGRHKPRRNRSGVGLRVRVEIVIIISLKCVSEHTNRGFTKRVDSFYFFRGRTPYVSANHYTEPEGRNASLHARYTTLFPVSVVSLHEPPNCPVRCHREPTTPHALDFPQERSSFLLSEPVVQETHDPHTNTRHQCTKLCIANHMSQAFACPSHSARVLPRRERPGTGERRVILKTRSTARRRRPPASCS
jgi:hypothetical protein